MGLLFYVGVKSGIHTTNLIYIYKSKGLQYPHQIITILIL